MEGMKRLNKTSSYYNIECVSDLHGILDELLVHLGGITIRSSGMAASKDFKMLGPENTWADWWNYTQPTINSGIGLIAKITRSNWIFFSVISWQIALLIVTVPIVLALYLWIINEQQHSYLDIIFDLITSYFFLSSVRMDEGAVKPPRYAFTLIALVIVTVYLGHAIKKYGDEKTVGGLTTPVGLHTTKILTHKNYVNLLLQNNFKASPYNFTEGDQQKELIHMFEMDEIKAFLYDEEFVVLIAELMCDIYVLNENVYPLYMGGVFGYSVGAEQQRDINSLIVSGREFISDTDLVNTYKADENVQQPYCKNKRKINFDVYQFYDFYELWILYGIFAGFSTIFNIISRCIIKINGKNSPKVSKNLYKLCFINLVPSLLMMKLRLREIQVNRLHQFSHIRKRFKPKLLNKIAYSYKKSVREIGKKKFKKLLICNAFKKGELSKKMIMHKKNKKRYMDHPILKTKISKRSLKYQSLIEILLFEAFLKCCYQMNILNEEHHVIYVTKYSGPHLKIAHLYQKQFYVLNKSSYNDIFLICINKAKEYLKEIHTNNNKIGLSQRYTNVLKLYLDQYKNKKINGLLAMHFCKKAMLKVMKTNDKTEKNKRFGKLVNKDFLENFQTQKRTSFKELPVRIKKGVKSSLRDVPLDELSVIAKKGYIQMDLPKYSLTMKSRPFSLPRNPVRPSNTRNPLLRNMNSAQNQCTNNEIVFA